MHKHFLVSWAIGTGSHPIFILYCILLFVKKRGLTKMNLFIFFPDKNKCNNQHLYLKSPDLQRYYHLFLVTLCYKRQTIPLICQNRFRLIFHFILHAPTTHFICISSTHNYVSVHSSTPKTTDFPDWSSCIFVNFRIAFRFVK